MIMEKIKYLLVCVLLLITVTSCSSDDDSSTPENQETYIRFTANGMDYDFPTPAIAQSTNVSINGNQSTNGVITEDISIWLPIGFTTGTFQLTGGFSEPGDYKIFYDSEDIGIQSFAPSTGEVTISSITNDFIEGSFNFSGEQNGTIISVTNGTFRSVTLN